MTTIQDSIIAKYLIEKRFKREANEWVSNLANYLITYHDDIFEGIAKDDAAFKYIDNTISYYMFYYSFNDYKTVNGCIDFNKLAYDLGYNDYDELIASNDYQISFDSSINGFIVFELN